MAIGYDEYGNPYEYGELEREPFTTYYGEGDYTGSSGFFSVGERGYVGYVDKYGYERIMRVPSIAHIGKNMPSHRQLTKLRRNLKRHVADARTILKIASPKSLKQGGGRRMRGYRHYRKSR